LKEKGQLRVNQAARGRNCPSLLCPDRPKADVNIILWPRSSFVVCHQLVAPSHQSEAVVERVCLQPQCACVDCTTKIPRRKLLHLVAGAAALPLLSRIADAEVYPSRPVRIVVGFPPGGGIDTIARLVGQWLSERLGQQFFVENRPGASSNIATEAVARAAPDGYTLLAIWTGNAWSGSLYGNLNFDFIRDIAPVAGVVRTVAVMVVNPTVPANSIPELIAYAQANPRKLNMATAGIGTVGHLYGEMFKVMAGVDLVLVHYRGDAHAITDLLGGHVQVYIGGLVATIEDIRAGRLRALGVTTAMRSQALPDVPTLGEFLPSFEASGWQGLGAPKNTAPEIIDTLNREIDAALADPNFQTRLADLASSPMPMTPAEFGKFIADETEKWGKVIRAASIKAQ
jgi:tripartite-type tricarboxylate transporter receptor subunit TctC